MANTFTSLYCHVVFSTKNRERWLRPEIEEDVWRYLGGICRTHDVKALQIGGVEDHVHLLLGMPPTLALSDVVKRIKELLENYVKPAVEMDGGAIQFKSYSDGVVNLMLQGSCSGCPSSMITLKAGIEGMMKRMIPEVTEVVAEAE